LKQDALLVVTQQHHQGTKLHKKSLLVHIVELSTAVVEGNLVTACADTRAANWLGKFKEGVAFALRNCRHCEIESCNMAAKFVERDVALRQLDSHKTRCDDVRQLTTATAAVLSEQDPPYFICKFIDTYISKFYIALHCCIEKGTTLYAFLMCLTLLLLLLLLLQLLQL